MLEENISDLELLMKTRSVLCPFDLYDSIPDLP